jgi:hypothetical protein
MNQELDKVWDELDRVVKDGDSCALISAMQPGKLVSNPIVFESFPDNL